MQFKHPEILYFLAFLIVPILVHLFQLQKFKKTPFTNVALLQKLAIQNRKSSQLKKWLILATRLVLFSAIIIAFSQPFFSTENALKKQTTFIYLDNSLSLSAKGNRSELFQNIVQEILENIDINETYNLRTNDDFYKNLTALEFKNTLKKVKLTVNPSALESVLIQIAQEKNTKTNTLNKYALVSDFQNISKNIFTNVTNVTPSVSLIKLENNSTNNLSIENTFINFVNNTNFTVEVVLKNQGSKKNDIPISIFNNNNLIAKQSFSIQKDATKSIFFPIQNQSIFNGKISLKNDDLFSFDNSFFFTVNRIEKINILSIGKSSKFLPKIYTDSEFNFNQKSLQNSNYNSFDKQQLIILNELPEISKTLATYLKKHINSGGNLVVIPPSNFIANKYTSFFNEMEVNLTKQQYKDTLRITNIHIKHPFFNNVFEKSIRNFQYPFVKNSYALHSKKATSLLSFENETDFISLINHKNGRIYWVSAALNLQNSNFVNSPLIVPVFYNFGKQHLKNHTKTYYNISESNTINIATNSKKDAVLSIQNEIENFIPQQQAFSNKVVLKTFNQPSKAGIFNVTNNSKFIKNIAFNYNSNESSTNFFDVKSFAKTNKSFTFSNSVKEILQENQKKNKVTWLWKWFLALAIVSLFFEILILKLFKP